MKISQTEHNIKRKMAESEIAPSQDLWENIEQELDQSSQPKSKKIWFKYAGIAAVLCIGFLVYQTLTPELRSLSTFALESKPAIEKDINFNAIKFDYVATPSPTQSEPKIEDEPQTVSNNNKLEVAVAEEKTTSLETEVDDLLGQAQNNLAKAKKEKQLLSEVNALLADAMQQTEDVEQKQILEDMKATALLAEIETEIELEKPPNLKDKIWDALVTNFNDIKRNVVLN